MTETTEAPQQTTAPRPRRRALVIAGLALLALFGASFAANIAINDGTQVEFGQGIEQIIACDAEGIATGTPGVTVTLTSSDPGFVTPALGPSPTPEFQFSVEGLVVSDIDEECSGKILTVGLYDQEGALIDDVVFDLDAGVLGAGPYRAGAFAGGTDTGCPAMDGDAFPDGTTVTSGEDCFPSSGVEDGLDADIDASLVAYVALETADASS